jgi:branched-chain amino acid transport system substrate-binding protein
MLGGGFAMGRIIGQTLEKAGSRDPAKLRDVLATTEFANLPLPATKIKFGSNGLNEYGTGVLAEWIKGEIRTVWPKGSQAIQPLF